MQVYAIKLDLEFDEARGVYTVTSRDIPGLRTEGSTPEEITHNVQEAVEALRLGMAEFGLELPLALRPEKAIYPDKMELLVAA
jgi:predicted RNase H-like HicB family nuclease